MNSLILALLILLTIYKEVRSECGVFITEINISAPKKPEKK